MSKIWRTIGVIFLILGIITLIFTAQAAHHTLDKLYEEIMGHEPDSTRWHLTIGIILAISGFILTFAPFKRKK